jgi:hypothetical protein
MAHPGEDEERHEPSAAPPAMSAAEKLAVEWEARHDVTARGHHASPRAVQEYLSHARAEESRRHVPEPSPAAPEPAERTELPAPPRRQPSWLRRLGFGRRRRLG